MKTSFFSLFTLLVVATFLQSCVFNFDTQDGFLPPVDEVEQRLSVSNFDRLDMGSAFDISVSQGNAFDVRVRGDRTDVGDLVVDSRSGTLRLYYRNNRSRRYQMEVDIVMPRLRGVAFSGASRSVVEGFKEQEVYIDLSGASRSDVRIQSKYLDFDLSGASTLNLTGDAARLDGEASGASLLSAFNMIADEAYVDASGASRVRVNVLNYLKADASGASNVRYRGNPKIEFRTSGGSVVERD